MRNAQFAMRNRGEGIHKKRETARRAERIYFLFLEINIRLRYNTICIALHPERRKKYAQLTREKAYKA